MVIKRFKSGLVPIGDVSGLVQRLRDFGLMRPKRPGPPLLQGRWNMIAALQCGHLLKIFEGDHPGQGRPATANPAFDRPDGAIACFGRFKLRESESTHHHQGFALRFGQKTNRHDQLL